MNYLNRLLSMKKLQKVRNFLNRPFYLLVSDKQGWWFIAGIALLIALILNHQLPYGLDHWHHPLKVLIICGFSGTFLLAYFLIYTVLPRLFPYLFPVSAWTIGREFTATVLLILFLSSFNWIYDIVTVHSGDRSSVSYLNLLSYTLMSGLLPLAVLFSVSWGKGKLRTNEAAVPVVEEVDETKRPVYVSEHHIHFSEGTFNVKYIYLVTSDENYSILHINDGNILKTVTVRCPLWLTESMLSSSQYFIRCHNSNIVNKDFIVHFKGNAGGGYIRLRGYPDKVKVSRNYYPKIINQLREYS